MILKTTNICGLRYRYLYEAGNRRAVIELVDIALKATDGNLDAGSAHLLNTLGVTHMSFNDIPACRKALLESQMIRKQILDLSDEERGSLSIRRNILGAEGMVAVCNLTIARVVLNKRDFKPALKKMRISQKNV